MVNLAVNVFCSVCVYFVLFFVIDLLNYLNLGFS